MKPLSDNKIRNQRSQRSPRYLRVATAKGKPYTTWRWRHVLARHFWEMGVGIVPRIDERSALTIWVAASFLLIGTFRFGVRSLFTYVFCGKIIRGDLFSLMVRRTLTFCWRHGGMVYWSKWEKVFKGKDMTNNGKGKKCFVLAT